MVKLSFYETSISRRTDLEVCYRPPSITDKWAAGFADISLVYSTTPTDEQLQKDLTTEGIQWCKRYDYPAMITAWDDDEEVLLPAGIDAYNRYFAWTSDSGIKPNGWQSMLQIIYYPGSMQSSLSEYSMTYHTRPVMRSELKQMKSCDRKGDKSGCSGSCCWCGISFFPWCS